MGLKSCAGELKKIVAVLQIDYKALRCILYRRRRFLFASNIGFIIKMAVG